MREKAGYLLSRHSWGAKVAGEMEEPRGATFCFGSPSVVGLQTTGFQGLLWWSRREAPHFAGFRVELGLELYQSSGNK